MIGSKGKDERAAVTAALARLNGVVPTLVQRLDERLFASHVRDVVAVAQAYLAGELPWAALLTGLEAALFQARACMVDDEAGEALVEAAEAVARYAGAAMARTGGEGVPPLQAPEKSKARMASPRGTASRPRETPGEPPNPDSTSPDSQGRPATGTGFALSNSKAKANPKVQARYPKPKPNPKAKSTGSTS
jgi:hypothetical protein